MHTWYVFETFSGDYQIDECQELRTHIQTCFDVVGAQASIPNANSLVNPESNYALSGSLYALSHNYASIASPVNSGFFRKMISGSSYGDLCNTFFIVSAGAYDVIKGERVKFQGYLEDFALSKEEADELIMSARNIVYKD